MNYIYSFKFLFQSLFFFALALLFGVSPSCKKNDVIPSYIYIPKIDVTTTYEIDGSNSHKITDAWLYVDDELIGAYELPAMIPVLASGKHTISVKAGIKLNGIANSRAYYSYYETYTVVTELELKKIDTILPIVTYVPNKIKWKEDFEEGGISLEKFTGSDTNFIKTNTIAEVFEGDYSGAITLKPTYTKLISVSQNKFAIPQNQSAVFLELNYKTNTPVLIGLYGKVPSGNIQEFQTIVLNPKTEWNKIYINLTYAANTIVNTTEFRVYFKAELTEGNSSATILLDNIKLLYN